MKYHDAAPVCRLNRRSGRTAAAIIDALIVDGIMVAMGIAQDSHPIFQVTEERVAVPERMLSDADRLPGKQQVPCIIQGVEHAAARDPRRYPA